MLGFIVKRLADSLVALLGVSLVVFLLIHLSGDPAVLLLPLDASVEDIAHFRDAMGFNDPLLIQYARFIRRALVGDFGLSLRVGQRALPLVLERLPATVELALASVALALLVGLGLGILSAARPGSAWDAAAMAGAVVGQAIPVFWLGLMLILLFGVEWRLLPTSGRGTLRHLVLPALSLSTFSVAAIARLTRSTMLEAMGQEYVITARAKGLPEWLVTLKHGLRNGLIPVVTIVGIQTGTLLGGAIVTETVFAWPGVGRLMIQAIYGRDYPVVQAAVFVVASLFVGVNLAVDLLYAVLDPRIRREA